MTPLDAQMARAAVRTVAYRRRHEGIDRARALVARLMTAALALALLPFWCACTAGWAVCVAAHWLWGRWTA